jgi:cell division protein FtsQ
MSALRSALLRPFPVRAGRRLRPGRWLAGLVLALVLLALGWLWLRDSSLVAVNNVKVVGISGREARFVRAGLEQAARDMTTLHVRMAPLRTAAAAYPIVRDLRVATDFPHGLRITVIPYVPVAAILADGRKTPVAADGTVLRGSVAPGDVPVVSLPIAPAGDRITDPRALRGLATLQAAPRGLGALVTKVWEGSNGLSVALRRGPLLYFGDTTRLRAKWLAARRVLGDPGSAGAHYIDVRLPDRPAAGGLPIPPQAPPAQAPAQPPTPAPTTP